MVVQEIKPISVQTLISILNYYHSHNWGLIWCLIWRRSKFTRQSRPFTFFRTPNSNITHFTTFLFGGHWKLLTTQENKLCRGRWVSEGFANKDLTHVFMMQPFWQVVSKDFHFQHSNTTFPIASFCFDTSQ